MGVLIWPERIYRSGRESVPGSGCRLFWCEVGMRVQYVFFFFWVLFQVIFGLVALGKGVFSFLFFCLLLA